MAFIIGQSFLSTLCTLRWGTFVFYAAFVIIAVVFVVLFIPETKVSNCKPPLWNYDNRQDADCCPRLEGLDDSLVPSGSF